MRTIGDRIIFRRLSLLPRASFFFAALGGLVGRLRRSIAADSMLLPRGFRPLLRNRLGALMGEQFCAALAFVG